MPSVPRPSCTRIACLAVLLFCTARCGGGPGQQPPPGNGSQVSVTLDVTTAAVTTGLRHGFTATVSGSPDTRVDWSVQEPGGGSVDAAGNYTAPGTPGEYHVVATSHADSSRHAAATVTVVEAPVITSFVASKAEVPSGAAVTISAVFSGGTGTVDHGIGSVTSGTPVSTGPLVTSQVYVLTVTNAAGTSVVSGLALVVDGAVAVAVVPSSATVLQGQTLRFAAVVGGALQTGVTWSLVEQGAGAIGPDGAYTPPSHGGIFHVVATSTADPSRSARAEVTVPRAWQPLSTVGLPGLEPVQMVSNASGRVALLAFQPYVSGSLADSLWVGILDPGGVWAWKAVATGGFNTGRSLSSPSIGIDDAGAVTVAWAQAPDAATAPNPYAIRRAANGTWGIPTLLDSTSYRTFTVRVASAPGGNSVVAWDRVVISAPPTKYQLVWKDWFAGTPGWSVEQTRGDIPVATDFSGLAVSASSTGGWIGSGPVGWVYTYGLNGIDVGGFATPPAGAGCTALAVASGDLDADFAYAVTGSGFDDGIYVGRGDHLGLARSWGLVPGSAGTSSPPSVVAFERDATQTGLLVYQVSTPDEDTILASVRVGNGWSPVVLAFGQRRVHAGDPALLQRATAALDGTGRGLILASDERTSGRSVTSVEFDGALSNRQPLPAVSASSFAGFPEVTRTPDGMLAVWIGSATGMVSSVYR